MSLTDGKSTNRSSVKRQAVGDFCYRTDAVGRTARKNLPVIVRIPFRSKQPM